MLCTSAVFRVFSKHEQNTVVEIKHDVYLYPEPSAPRQLCHHHTLLIHGRGNLLVDISLTVSTQDAVLLAVLVL